MGTGVLLELLVGVWSTEEWWAGCRLVVHIGEWLREYSKAGELVGEDMPCVVIGIAVVGCTLAFVVCLLLGPDMRSVVEQYIRHHRIGEEFWLFFELLPALVSCGNFHQTGQ